MAPNSGDVTQPPELKASSGFASVFKSLTGAGKSARNNTPAPATVQKANGVATGQSYHGPPDFDRFCRQLKPGNELQERISAAEALKFAVQDYPLEGVTSIFNAGKDLIEYTNPPEARSVGYELLSACVRYDGSTEPERLAYFNVITDPGHPDDFHLQLNALIELSRHGKDLSGFHYQILPLLTTWLRKSFDVTSKQRKNASRHQRTYKTKLPVGEETSLSLLFAFIVDVIKFGFNISSGETTSALLDIVLHICIHTAYTADLKACVGVIDAIVTYGEMPPEHLGSCIKVLCSIHCLVNDVQTEAWRSITTFCQSHHGQKTVIFLLDILRTPTIDQADPKQVVREIRGAATVLGRIFSMDTKDHFPLVPFTLLMQALTQAVAVQHTKIENDVLMLILSLLKNDENGAQHVKTNVLEEEWQMMFEVVLKCSKRVLDSVDSHGSGTRSPFSSPLVQDAAPEQNYASSIRENLERIIYRIEELLRLFTDEDFSQREECINFLLSVHCYLPEDAAHLVIEFYASNRYCYPSDQNYTMNIKRLANAFLADRSQPSQVRLRALTAITDPFPVFKMVDGTEIAAFIETFVRLIVKDLSEEKDTEVLQEIVAFAVQIAEAAEEPLFTWIIDAMKDSVLNDLLQPAIGSPSGSRQGILGSKSASSSQVPLQPTQSPSSVVTRGLVHIFMKTMDQQGTKSLRVFQDLLWIAKSKQCEVDARIQALKMLFRLRADWAGRVFLTPFTESDGLAASLYRTQASFARKLAADDAAQTHRQSRMEDAGSTRGSRSTSFSQGPGNRAQPFRSMSGVTRTLARDHQKWMSPDPDALPEPASGAASHTLFSFAGTLSKTAHFHDEYDGTEKAPTSENSSWEEEISTDIPAPSEGHGTESNVISHVVLDMSVLLDTVISLMRGCDWEVYSYVLVHLPSQLTNQALFRAAITQVRSLRALLCEQIKNGSFQEPPTNSGLYKADVSICLFQILNMVMSYHQHFSKLEDDEMIQTFIRGVGERTSKSCIHALSICCHELPMATSRSLVSLLNKMSQIITQSPVAVHILEFLACLARLPRVYVNFREDEYRIVFAICFRYLEYVRDQSGKDPSQRSSQISGRASVASSDSIRGMAYVGESNFQPNASDDLPQYVYALAYHVIIFWFLTLKIPDRASHVSWIAKNLVSTDLNGKESIDEQAQVTLDFLQRVTYADVEESRPDPDFTTERCGRINKNRWVIGNALVTIEQLHTGDWAQITKRQPSGTSCFIIREKYNQPFPHQVPPPSDDGRVMEAADVVQPSHLLVQMLAGAPQPSSDNYRPLPIPMDDFMDRFVKTLDRIFTVDGYKVGVIYIGENQVNEVEILANESGSNDYTEFLHNLGTVVPLKGASFNTQGLDREYDTDGEFAICWRDRVTEIVFHATTEMPTNLERDPLCINKKKHIGNDFVNIIFNNSGFPFSFDTFPSDFNYVNIVITPQSRETFLAARNRKREESQNAFFKVQVMSKAGFPEISPAAETKLVGLKALPGFIRLLALNASVFSFVWSNRHGDNHVSSWRARLREIQRVKERYSTKTSSFSTPTSPPGTANSATQQESANKMRESITNLRRSSVANFLTSAPAKEDLISQRSSMISTAETEVASSGSEGTLLDTLDFSRWGGQGKVK